jgi:tetratricopeptide (TPR) repeat protein
LFLVIFLHRLDITRKSMTKDSSEIAKLTERISKDPKSKLFVPLAEEYKKIGDIEMAIHVLSEGLKINPGYLTARSFLGRLLLEQRNFAASQTEFEEVVKAIPDNLLAHRKLGDLHLLQNRQEEALKHYKIVLTLNPGDSEMASVISDIEAGMAASSKVVQQKPQTSLNHESPSPSNPLQSSAGTSSLTLPSSSERTALKETATDTSAARTSGGSPLLEGNDPTVEKPVTAQIDEPPQLREQLAAMGQQPTAPFIDQEEAEEVFVVEPLSDDNAPFSAPTSSDVDIFSEKAFETNPAEELNEVLAATSRPVFEEEILSETKTEQSGIPDSSAIVSDESEPANPRQEQAFVQPGTDDFTTDTLAELYIAQGFFEKAIDIYQRMLTENPNSLGLKDKLDRVRAKAADESETEFTQAIEEKTVPSPTEEELLFAEPKEFVSPGKGQEKEATSKSELFVEPQGDFTQSPILANKTEIEIFGEPQEYRPAKEPEEWTGPPPGGPSVDEIFMPPQEETSKLQSQYIDFEPSEYIPPTAEQLPIEKETAHTPPKSGTAAHKATIDRLEHWLSNIKKEK